VNENNYKCRVEKGFFFSFKVFVLIYIFLLSFTLLHGDASGGEWEERRINVGYKLFPSFLAADININKKQGEDGKLLLLVLYSDKQQFADSLAQELSATGTVRNISLRVEAVAFAALPQYKNRKVAGLFISQKISSDIDTIIAFARVKNAIIFSPFKGDVKKGISCGFSVTDRVEPFINVSALRLAKIKLKQFFMRVAKSHDR
jgi:hypothetical protein